MFITNRYLTALDVIFNAAEVIERYDAVAVGERVINISATLAAIVIGVCSYVWTALMLWWEDNGDRTLTAIVRFTFLFIDACGFCYYAGRKLRPVANRYCARLADSAFYALASV